MSSPSSVAVAAPIYVLDGGLGTTLEDRFGVRLSPKETPLWATHLLITDITTLGACHTAFARAGADILTTATYQATNAAAFAATRAPPDNPQGVSCDAIPGYVRRAVALCEEAFTIVDTDAHGAAEQHHLTRPRRGQVALSLGPYGACMKTAAEYTGAYDAGHNNEEALLEWHRTRWRLLACDDIVGMSDGGVDYVAFETMPRVDEIRAVRRCLRALTAGDKCRFWISAVFPHDSRMPDGSLPQDAVHAMLAPSNGAAVPWAIGVNCTAIQDLKPIVEGYEEAVADLVSRGLMRKWPALVLYPDGTNGGSYDPETKTWKQTDVPMEIPWEKQLYLIAQETQ